MQSKFRALMEVLKHPYRTEDGVKTDNSILMIYQPDKEFEFREYLTDIFIPQLSAKDLSFRALDLTGFIFESIDPETIEAIQEDEFEDYQWMKQGLSQRMERRLVEKISDLSNEVPGGTVLVYATVALFPLLRFGEVLRDLRDLNAYIVIAFPGEEEGGKLHFMNQSDGGNYLALKIV